MKPLSETLVTSQWLCDCTSIFWFLNKSPELEIPNQKQHEEACAGIDGSGGHSANLATACYGA